MAPRPAANHQATAEQGAKHLGRPSGAPSARAPRPPPAAPERPTGRRAEQSFNSVPDRVFLIQVAASKTKIYMVLELVNGGELLDRILYYVSDSPPVASLLLQRQLTSRRPVRESSRSRSSPGANSLCRMPAGSAEQRIVLYLELYASCVEYITPLRDSMSSVFPSAHLAFASIDLNAHTVFAITTALAILQTVCLRNLSLLSYLSADGVMATIAVILCLFWVACSGSDTPMCVLPLHQEGRSAIVGDHPVHSHHNDRRRMCMRGIIHLSQPDD
ncbi:hypothetical protein ZEAMMB73_Zm00001d008856 [Zea mays]|uniref:Uncharacterized protein n=1 Tax=Zea mays TaxID=4577 RepID=A0A1D6FGD9_MAIZE|nr:hypothetical protein ZEAMMB73_Zm00001d008856 [Zea mays]